MKCINCQEEHTNKFCPNCGEKADVPKITLQTILSSAFSTITNMDSGFLHNVKQLTIAPRQLITQYLAGKRKGIYNPVTYVFLNITIYLILDALLPNSTELESIDSKIYDWGYKVGRFSTVYLKYTTLSGVLWLSLVTRLIYQRYNFAEHLAINSFIIGQLTFFTSILLVLFIWPIWVVFLIMFGTIIFIYQIFKKGEEPIFDVVIAIFCTTLYYLLYGLMAILGAYLMA